MQESGTHADVAEKTSTRRTWLNEDMKTAKQEPQRATNHSLVVIECISHSTMIGRVDRATAERLVNKRATTTTRCAVICITFLSIDFRESFYCLISTFF